MNVDKTQTINITPLSDLVSPTHDNNTTNAIVVDSGGLDIKVSLLWPSKYQRKSL